MACHLGHPEHDGQCRLIPCAWCGASDHYAGKSCPKVKQCTEQGSKFRDVEYIPPPYQEWFSVTNKAPVPKKPRAPAKKKEKATK